jgi:hypothetical protein
VALWSFPYECASTFSFAHSTMGQLGDISPQETIAVRSYRASVTSAASGADIDLR